jgi:hypothetical protein
MTQMKHARNARKALVVLSDGGDNVSRRNLRELEAALIESDVQVYAMGIFDSDYSVRHTPEERNGPRLLDRVALDTGGRDFPVAGLDNLPDIRRSNRPRVAQSVRFGLCAGYPDGRRQIPSRRSEAGDARGG